MKTVLSIMVILVAAILVVLAADSRADCPSQPEAQLANFLLIDGIEEFNVDFALQWSDSAAVLFLQPFDAVVLHTIFEENQVDVFIFSDAAMNRLTIWLCTSGQGQTRELLYIAEYEGDDADGLHAPSGLATNAIGRLFEPESDVIYVADRGNDRILELAFDPNDVERLLRFNRSFGEGNLEWPVDVAVSEYKDQGADEADIYVVDWGHQSNTGELVRFDKDGNLEYNTRYVYFPESDTVFFELSHPISVACYPDTLEGWSHIYITEAANNPLIELVSKTDGPALFMMSEDLMLGQGFWQPGGIAFDDFGRIYIANEAAGVIQVYGPYLQCRYTSLGEPGIRGIDLRYPSNLVIDTYNGFCEALLLEQFNRQSGLKTVFIENGYQAQNRSRGFRGQGMLIKPAAVLEAQLPLSYSLHDVYPNPFNAECKIGFSVPVKTRVVIEVFDILGKRITRLIDDEFSAGEHSVIFRAENLSSGTYLYKMRAGNFRQAKTFILLK